MLEDGKEKNGIEFFVSPCAQISFLELKCNSMTHEAQTDEQTW